MPEPSAKRAVLAMIAGFSDREAERILRHFQLDQMQPDASSRMFLPCSSI
jgi:hypothetical protein